MALLQATLLSKLLHEKQTTYLSLLDADVPRGVLYHPFDGKPLLQVEHLVYHARHVPRSACRRILPKAIMPTRTILYLAMIMQANVLLSITCPRHRVCHTVLSQLEVPHATRVRWPLLLAAAVTMLRTSGCCLLFMIRSLDFPGCLCLLLRGHVRPLVDVLVGEQQRHERRDVVGAACRHGDV
jgi:hypothetical protein